MNLSKASWHFQPKFCQAQTSYQLIEIQMVFHSDKNHAHNIKQIQFYYTYQAKKIQLDTGFETTRKFEGM